MYTWSERTNDCLSDHIKEVLHAREVAAPIATCSRTACYHDEMGVSCLVCLSYCTLGVQVLQPAKLAARKVTSSTTKMSCGLPTMLGPCALKVAGVIRVVRNNIDCRDPQVVSYRRLYARADGAAPGPIFVRLPTQAREPRRCELQVIAESL